VAIRRSSSKGGQDGRRGPNGTSSISFARYRHADDEGHFALDAAMERAGWQQIMMVWQQQQGQQKIVPPKSKGSQLNRAIKFPLAPAPSARTKAVQRSLTTRFFSTSTPAPPPLVQRSSSAPATVTSMPSINRNGALGFRKRAKLERAVSHTPRTKLSCASNFQRSNRRSSGDLSSLAKGRNGKTMM
jgi:hypothetical protein